MEVAFQNVNKTRYPPTNITFIEEQELIQLLKPILTQGSVTPFQLLNRELQSISTPFRDMIVSNVSLPSTPLQMCEYKDIKQPQLIPPFQLLMTQLSDSDQRQFIRKILLIQQVVQIVSFVFYTQYNLNESQKTTLYYSIRNLLSDQSSFLTLYAMEIIIHVFILNRGKDMNEFRTNLYTTLHDKDFIQFCVPNMGGSSAPQVIHTLFNAIIDKRTIIQITNDRVKLYNRYVIQFIQAPFMNEYREEKVIQSISKAIGKDLNIFVNPSFVNEYRAQKRQQPRRFRYV